MISDLVFDQIEGNFWYAAYGPFRVVMMKDTGYINASKMCSSGGKDYCDWLKNKSSKELIKALEQQMVQENSNLPLENTDARIIGSVISSCKKINTGNKTEIDCIISGTY